MKRRKNFFSAILVAALILAAPACSQTPAPTDSVLQESSLSSTNGERKESQSSLTAATTSPQAIQDLADNFYKKAEDAQTNKKLAATVNGYPIYYAVIERNKAMDNISASLSRQEIEASTGLTDEEKQNLLDEMDIKVNQSDRQRLDDLIRHRVMIQEAEKKGFSADGEKAYDQAKQNYDLMKQAAEDAQADWETKEFYRIFVEDYCKAMGWSEEDYIQMSAESFGEGQLVQQLLDDFGAESIDEPNFAAYIDKAVKQADIQYYI